MTLPAIPAHRSADLDHVRGATRAQLISEAQELAESIGHHLNDAFQQSVALGRRMNAILDEAEAAGEAAPIGQLDQQVAPGLSSRHLRKSRDAARRIDQLANELETPTSFTEALAIPLPGQPDRPPKPKRAPMTYTLPDHAQALHDAIDAGETEAITEAEAIARRIGWTPPGEAAPTARATRHQPAVRPTVQRPAPLPTPDGRQNGQKRQVEPRWK